ncbi:M56 family metallopeptidase [Arenimonas metalli]|nr:M56 family metallopeptidase [Arenimonas metalli]
MNRELLGLLLEVTVAGSAAILVVLLLRRPILAWFGASIAYASWWLVPATLAAVALPATVVPTLPLPSVAMATAWGEAPARIVAAVSFDATPWVLATWVIGFVVAGWRLVAQQRRFVRSLGELCPRADGLLQSTASLGLPAVVGWRARIVLPADFERRYAPRHQQLVLCHEQVHHRRRDHWANAFVAGLRCLFWFNPLVHFAAGRFRQDQELACDAVVLTRFPGQRRAYGEALLKPQLAIEPLPVGCHWFGSHPLKERIAMLTRPLPSKPRWIAGLALVAALTLVGGWTAWAAQPGRGLPAAAPEAGEVGLAMTIKFDGKGERTESLNLPAKTPRTLEYQQDGQAWRVQVALSPLDDGTVFVVMDIHRDGVRQGQPKMVIKPASGGAIGLGERLPDGRWKGVEIELQVTLPQAG